MNDDIAPSMEYINYICDQLKHERASVLIGAGFSLNADKRSSMAKKYPLWEELGDAFAKRLSETGYDELKKQDPTILAEELEAAFGRSELDKIILETIPDEQYLPSQVHTKLLRMPWVGMYLLRIMTRFLREPPKIYRTNGLKS